MSSALHRLIATVYADTPGAFWRCGGNHGEPPNIPTVGRPEVTVIQRVDTDDTAIPVEMVNWADAVGPLRQVTEEILPLVEMSGWECLGWYHGFHQHPFSGGWGIYLRVDRIAALAEALTNRRHSPSLVPLPGEACYRQLLAAVTRHEEFHFAAEVFALQVEERSGRPTRRRYERSVYATAFPGSDCIEEALATAAARIGVSPQLMDAYDLISSSLPPAYAQYRDFLGAAPFQRGLDRLGGQIAEGKVTGQCRPYRFPRPAGIGDRSVVPIYHVWPAGQEDGMLAHSFPYFQFMSLRDFERFTLERYGMTRTERTRHSAFRHPSGHLLPFPRGLGGNEETPPYLFSELAKVEKLQTREIKAIAQEWGSARQRGRKSN